MGGRGGGKGRRGRMEEHTKEREQIYIKTVKSSQLERTTQKKKKKESRAQINPNAAWSQINK
jgi:ribosomal protein L24